jgi:hypothetical protein
MTNEHRAGIDVQHVEHPKRGRLTRLTWHGWQVDVDALNVTVPPQQNPARTGDLDTLLRVAYRMLDVAIARQRRPLAVLRAELPEPLIAEIVDVLRAAQRTTPTAAGTSAQPTSTQPPARHGTTPA